MNIAPLLCHVTHDDFSSLILPALQKSLLRNPEVVLESKCYMNYKVLLENYSLNQTYKSILKLGIKVTQSTALIRRQ